MNLKNIKLFLGVVFVQVFILNNIQFSGYLNPYYYIIFILSIPTKNSKISTLLLSFLIGFIIDIFSFSYGLHAFSCVLIGYLKIIWISKTNYTKNAEEEFELRNLNMSHFIITMSYFVLIHHFTLFSLEVFSFSEIIFILKSTFISGAFTLILLIIHKVFIIGEK